MNRPAHSSKAPLAAGGDSRDPIAIIGMSCRFPGAPNISAFWRLLLEGRDAISEVPADRWDIGDYYDPNPLAPGKMNTKWGGFIERVDEFDPQFFGISPREAACMDPQQRLLLEVAWEALEDAGLDVERLAGTAAGVFVGLSSSDYGRADTNPAAIEAYMGTGNAGSIAANRLSYLFDFRGPSLVVDTACSSALVAVHLACASLWKGESAVALVGGVNIMLSPTITIAFTKAGMMSPDGRCKAFDAAANGYVRGEGAGVVVLKPLAEALADGDPVCAVIRGTAVNQDGRSNGITAPNRESQEAVIRDACASAGIPPGQLDYVETHGTGTALGDPIETRALGSALMEGRMPGQYCLIGSVKTNIGHLEAAAGIASLIKAALALQHRLIPASLHFKTPNPLIPFQDLQLKVPQSAAQWPAISRPALAGVNSFGFGGTNAHVILEEAPGSVPRWQADSNGAVERPALLPLSARSEDGLRAAAGRYREFLGGNETNGRLADICFTAGARRNHHDYRVAIVGRSAAELSARIGKFAGQEPAQGVLSGRRRPDRRVKLAFVFPGQGSQWYAMGRQLLDREPVFRDTLRACEELFGSYAHWSLLQELTAGDFQSRLDQTEFAQPAIFAVQTALAALWRSWGVVPDAVVGHSMGEVAAAHFAGMLSLPDAVRIVFHRARLMQRSTDMGRMAVVRTSVQDAERMIQSHEDEVSIAACNSPRMTVLSGSTSVLAEVLESNKAQVAYQYLPVNYAFHSPQMAALQSEIIDSLQGLDSRDGSSLMVSTVTGEPISGSELNPVYWWTNIRNQVLFSAAIERLLADGCNAFLEISAHPALLGAISECASGSDLVLIPSLRRNADEQEQMLGSLGSLYVAGYPMDWRQLCPQGRNTSLPMHAWQHQAFWHPGIARGGARAVRQEASKHPLLGRRLDSATPVWDCDLGVLRLPYLADHRVQGKIVYPAAAYLETVVAAFVEVSGPVACVLSDVKLSRPLVLPENGTRRVETVLSQGPDEVRSFHFYSPSEGDQKSWTLHASGFVEVAGGTPVSAEPEFLEALRRRCGEEIPRAECYRRLREMGLQYGPMFQGIGQIWRGRNEALARIEPPAGIEADLDLYHVHPTLLDACGQALLAAASESGRSFVPNSIDRFRLHRRAAPGELWVYARLASPPGSHAPLLTGDGQVFDSAGNVIAEVEGLQLQSLRSAPQPAREDLADWLYQLDWRPLPLDAQSAEDVSAGTWFIFADAGGLWKPLASFLSNHGQDCVALFPGREFLCHSGGEGRTYYEISPEDPSHLAMVLENELRANTRQCRGVIHLWSLTEGDDPPADVITLERAQTLGCGSVLHLVQQLVKADLESTPHIWLVTRGAQRIGSDLAPISVTHAPLWGLGRVLANEHPEFRCKIVDIGFAATGDDLAAFSEEIWGGSAESQLVFRAGVRHVARLARMVKTAGDAPGSDSNRLSVPGNGPFRLSVSTPGSLDSLELQEVSRMPVRAGEIEIAVRAAGLNFRDVMKCLGIYPAAPGDGFWLGDESAGTVVAVGEGVTDFRPGDEVLAIAPASFGNYVTAPAAFAAPKPAHLSFEEAAAIPIAFTTAWYALRHLARLAPGESVLIHAAAGGVGLAAVQIAQHTGAKVFATAGSAAKREYLNNLGVEHVFDSRSLAFADEIMRVTGRRGVDVVLNSLAGAAIGKSLSVLAPHGRFVEIGKRDIFQNSQIGLSPFRNNLCFFAIDMEKVFHQRQHFGSALLREVMALFEQGALKPLPCSVFPLPDAAVGFRHLAQAKNIGKVVVSFPQAATTAAAKVDLLRPDRTYLITGGFGGLGTALARWMIACGVRNLALLGRKPPTASVEETLRSGLGDDVRIEVISADISDGGQTRAALDQIRKTMPPLAGIVHAAGVLDDALLLHLNRERFSAVLAPKVSGAWNLHTATLGTPLDFFVLFSSLASLLGSPGQGNYAAGNAFLDALAQYRRAQDMPALSINWGPWAEAGMAAGTAARKLSELGIGSILPAQGLALFERLIRLDAGQAIAVNMDWQQWSRQAVFPARSSLFADFQVESGPESSTARVSLIRRQIEDAQPSLRQHLIESYMIAELARVLQVDAFRLDVHAPLDALGLDSLMAIEYKHRLDTELGVDLSIVGLLDGPTISQIASQLLDAVGLAANDGVHSETGMRETAGSLEMFSGEETGSLLNADWQQEKAAGG